MPANTDPWFYILIAGILTSVVLPILFNLKIFVRTSDYSLDRQGDEKKHADLQLYMEQHFVRKDALSEFKTDLDKRLDEIREVLRELARSLSDLKRG